MTNLTYLVIILIVISFAKGISKNELQSRILSKKGDGKPDTKIEENNNSHASTGAMNSFEESQCDLLSDGPICLYNGDRVLLPYAKPKGLVGYWNFDEMKPLDNSGNRNHAIGVVKPGPAFGGLGSSAFFSNGEYIKVPYTDSFKSDDFTITFWLFVIQDFFKSSKGNRYSPLIQRGDDNMSSKVYKRTPGLYLDRKDKNLKFYVKTQNEDEAYIQGESLLSNAKVTNQRWLHIALVKTDNKLKLYVNGILDAQGILKSNIDNTGNTGPLYIGNVPWLKDQCSFPFLIDELRYYNIAVDEDRIQAEASPVLGGIEPSFLQLGCMNCSLKEASQSCVDGYRLCSSIELHTGGYQIARSMGWINWNTHLWTHGALKTPTDFEKLQGLALCCVEIK